MRLKTASLGRALLAAERSIALLQRCQPLNHRSELTRLQVAWARGQPELPRFAYSPAPRLGQLRQTLQGLEALSSAGPWGELVAGRAAELDREAALVEALGQVDFVARARQRFALPQRAEQEAAAEVAKQWAQSPRSAEHDVEPLCASDDRQAKDSLYCQTRALLNELGVPFRIEISGQLTAMAATGDGVIFIAGGRQLSAREARRVALHEVCGHALPRANAAADGTLLLLAGSAGAQDDEEGRALLIERRAGLLGGARRFTLALRHIAAQALFAGANWVDVVRELLARDCPSDTAVAIACRVLRGGGLGREIVYLPAMLRVEACIESCPPADDCFARARVSTRWVQRMMALGKPPALLDVPRGYVSSATTGQ